MRSLMHQNGDKLDVIAWSWLADAAVPYQISDAHAATAALRLSCYLFFVLRR